ncbi:MAG: DPP IV N-terminal domain-containing protein, partial [Chitinophagaceae bacterium]
PDSKKVAYVQGHNIYVEDVTTHVITQLTKDGSSRLINGTFDWVYEEEFDCRDGFRWSPDSKSIAYWQLDATKIRNFNMINNTDSIYSRVIPVEYPKVGEDPSACKIGVVNIKTIKTTWMNVPGNNKQHYIPRMEWSGMNELIVQQLTRRQNESRLFTVNATTGAANVIYTEVSKAWIDIESSWTTPVNSAYGIGWRWLNNQTQFLWLSEKDGWRHIYLLNKDGKKETLLTPGDYDVITIAGYDEASNVVYFMASPNNPTQQYLYKVALDGTGKAERVSPA